VIGLVHASDHPKASLAEALLLELKDQVQQANSPAYGRGKPSRAASRRR
jgi:hypothetical protein